MLNLDPHSNMAGYTTFLALALAFALGLYAALWLVSRIPFVRELLGPNMFCGKNGRGYCWHGFVIQVSPNACGQIAGATYDVVAIGSGADTQ